MVDKDIWTLSREHYERKKAASPGARAKRAAGAAGKTAGRIAGGLGRAGGEFAARMGRGLKVAGKKLKKYKKQQAKARAEAAKNAPRGKGSKKAKKGFDVSSFGAGMMEGVNAVNTMSLDDMMAGKMPRRKRR